MKTNLFSILFILLIFLSIFILNPLIVESAITKDDVNDEIPKEYVPIYQKAAQKYGVSWYLLASVHNQESAFSTNLSTSSAGAVGHGQFMKCTWVGWRYLGCVGSLGNSPYITEQALVDPDIIKLYGGMGVDGNQDGKSDPRDIVDAIYSMARYLGSTMVSFKNEDKNVRDALYEYNKDLDYVEEITKRYYRYKAGWKGGTSAESTSNTGALDLNMWWTGTVGSPVEDDSIPESGSGEEGSEGVVEEEFVSKFKDYVIDIKNVGINYKHNYNSLYTDYKINKYVKYILNVLYNVSFMFGIICIGYLSILWMCILMARTRFEPAYKVVEFITNGKLDAFEDLGKSIKFSLFLVVFISISVSGLMPSIFVLVYKVLSDLISVVFLF